jgi:hypothetical protein
MIRGSGYRGRQPSWRQVGARPMAEPAGMLAPALSHARQGACPARRQGTAFRQPAPILVRKGTPAPWKTAPPATVIPISASSTITEFSTLQPVGFRARRPDRMAQRNRARRGQTYTRVRCTSTHDRPGIAICCGRGFQITYWRFTTPREHGASRAERCPPPLPGGALSLPAAASRAAGAAPRELAC